MPFIEILSALTILLLSRRSLNRQLKKIHARASKPKLVRRAIYQPAIKLIPVFDNLLQ